MKIALILNLLTANVYAQYPSLVAQIQNLTTEKIAIERSLEAKQKELRSVISQSDLVRMLDQSPPQRGCAFRVTGDGDLTVEAVDDRGQVQYFQLPGQYLGSEVTVLTDAQNFIESKAPSRNVGIQASISMPNFLYEVRVNLDNEGRVVYAGFRQSSYVKDYDYYGTKEIFRLECKQPR